MGGQRCRAHAADARTASHGRPRCCARLWVRRPILGRLRPMGRPTRGQPEGPESGISADRSANRPARLMPRSGSRAPIQRSAPVTAISSRSGPGQQGRSWRFDSSRPDHSPDLRARHRVALVACGRWRTRTSLARTKPDDGAALFACGARRAGSYVSEPRATPTGIDSDRSPRASRGARARHSRQVGAAWATRRPLRRVVQKLGLSGSSSRTASAS